MLSNWGVATDYCSTKVLLSGISVGGQGFNGRDKFVIVGIAPLGKTLGYFSALFLHVDLSCTNLQIISV